MSERIEITPSVSVLRMTQDRALEKTWLQSHDIPVADFCVASDIDAATDAVESVGLPAIMKTVRGGYDGKGQKLMREIDDVKSAYEALGDGTGGGVVVVEQYLDVKTEISVICARARDGSMTVFPTFTNLHVRGILDSTASFPDREEAHEYLSTLAANITEGLGVVGLLTVEMFICSDRRVLVNELAPRPHNSGHLTIEAARTSQFEQLVRMMAGLPLGNPGLYAPAAMGESPGRHLAGRGRWRSAMGPAYRVTTREVAPLRQEGATARPQDGPHHRDGRRRRHGDKHGATRQGSPTGSSGLTRICRIHRIKINISCPILHILVNSVCYN